MKQLFTIALTAFVLAVTGQAPHTYTMGHDPLGSHNFNLYGALNSYSDTASYSFTYATDPGFTSPLTTVPQTKRTDSLQVVWATVNGLAPGTTYYYYLAATTSHGTTYGAHQHFYSDTTAFLFENNGADVYGNSYAELNGKITGFGSGTNLSFEYGLTPDFGLTVASNYPVVTDSFTHYFRGYPSPLTPGAHYYYRIKAATATDSIYSDIRSFDLSGPFTIVQALPATNITSTSADLHGTVQGFKVPIKINSELDGTSSHFHSALVYYDPTPGVINYTYSASNLQANMHYSTRLKIDSWVGNFYGDSAFSTIATEIRPLTVPTANISVYPNPASSVLTIDMGNLPVIESTIEMFDISGQIVRETKVSSNAKIAIDVAGLENGFYMLKVINGTSLSGVKILIAR